jgi:hypothetical protein
MKLMLIYGALISTFCISQALAQQSIDSSSTIYATKPWIQQPTKPEQQIDGSATSQLISPADLKRPWIQQAPLQIVGKEWLEKCNDDLFDILKLLSKGHDQQLDGLRQQQTKLDLTTQIENRIKLIKNLLSP